MLYTLRFFLSSKCSLFHNANSFGSRIIHILYIGCAKIEKNNSGAKGLNYDKDKGYITWRIMSVYGYNSLYPPQTKVVESSSVIIFLKSWLLWDDVEKYGTAG